MSENEHDAEFYRLALQAQSCTGSELFNRVEPTLPVELPMSVVKEIGLHPFKDWFCYDTAREIWKACRRALLVDGDAA